MAIHRNAPGNIGGAATYIGGVNQRRAGGVDLGDDGVPIASVGCLEGAGRRRKSAGDGVAGDVRAARAIDGDAVARTSHVVTAAAAEIGGVNQSGSRRSDLGDESVPVASESGLQRILCRKVGGIG